MFAGRGILDAVVTKGRDATLWRPDIAARCPYQLMSRFGEELAFGFEPIGIGVAG